MKPSVLPTLLLMTCSVITSASPPASKTQVKEHYANLANAIYSDALSAARTLQQSVNTFIATPDNQTHQKAKDAWKSARIPYGQSEVFRFGNPNVDDWEGQVNAWPLDEGLIDYVNTVAYEYEEGNELGSANIIAGDLEISTNLLRDLHEKGGSEANVATGYHAIEFLLWGQDLNDQVQDHGKRVYTDYVIGDGCSNGNCDRRAAYLKTATDLLVSDLEDIVADWAIGNTENYRAKFLALDDDEALRRMLFGMGSLSLGELAGQRMNAALLANSQEDEHSCFSDNTHVDIIENALGIRNIYLGEYTDLANQPHPGESLSQLVREVDRSLDDQLRAALESTLEKVEKIEVNAKNGIFFDHQIMPDYPDQNSQVKAAIDALKLQTILIEKIASVLNIDNLQSESGG